MSQRGSRRHSSLHLRWRLDCMVALLVLQKQPNSLIFVLQTLFKLYEIAVVIAVVQMTWRIKIYMHTCMSVWHPVSMLTIDSLNIRKHKHNTISKQNYLSFVEHVWFSRCMLGACWSIKYSIQLLLHITFNCHAFCVMSIGRCRPAKRKYETQCLCHDYLV